MRTVERRPLNSLRHAVLKPRRSLDLSFALQGLFGRFERIEEKHADSHRADAARNRRNPSGPLLGSFELNVARQLSARQPIHSHVNHYRARLDPVSPNQTRLTYGDYKNIGARHLVA